MLPLLLLVVSLGNVCQGGVYLGANTVEAHGPLARLALDSMTAGGHLRYLGGPGGVPTAQLRYAAPLAVARVPVAPVPVAPVPVAPAPVAAARLSAHVDVVHHVPTVADVPVTRYVAQPGYVQKLVDVTKTKVATAKLQVRRPAIQKQFYDIEERTVVRPVGSAVVELEEPISKKVVTPFTVVPSVQHTVANYQRPVAYPVNAYPFLAPYPFQVPVQTYPPFFIQQTPGISQYPQRPQYPPQYPQRPQIPPQQQIPQRPQIPPQQQIPQQPQFPPQQVPQQPQIPQPQPPQQLPSFPQPIGPPESSESNEFDFSDTVVVDNPELGRSGVSNRKESEQDNTSRHAEDIAQELSGNENTEQAESPHETSSDQQIIDEFQTRQLLRQFFSNNDLLPEQIAKQFPAPQNLQQTPLKHNSNIQRSDENEPKIKSEENSESISQESRTIDVPTASFQSRKSQNRQVKPAEGFASEGEIASTRALSPEEAQNNQQKLIELLSGRGQISELQLSRSGVKISPVGDAGVVRGRVLSVTPAARSEEGEERVSTRRVVVSRPVQTLEEVDVQQPFAQVERVAVHEPALLKTVHTHVARVPTAVPVLTRTLAPVAYH